MSGPYMPLDRRELLAASAIAGAALLAKPQAAVAVERKRYAMKKSINQWAFPYPEKMNLEQCMRLAKAAGFDAIELNYDLDNDLSPKSGPKEYAAIRKLADTIGIQISGLCSFLFWPYALTNNDNAKRERGFELAGKMTQAAHDLGVENLLVVPGAVHIPWRTDYDPVPNDVCDKRAREAIGKLLPTAEKLKVKMNIENIFFNGYLMTPGEMAAFVDSFNSERVKVHFGRLVQGDVQRFEARNVLALKFVMYEALGGGAPRSLRSDNLGKTHGATLLRMEIDVPDDVAAASVRRARRAPIARS